MKPTDSELEILQILWKNGPCTVRFINDELNKEKKVGYTTTLKFMQIMTEKGLLVRDTSHRTHIYKATIDESQTQGELLDRLLDTAFGGSASKLMMHVLGNSKTSQKELDEIRSYLKQMEEGREG